MPLLEHMSDIMDANQSSYTLYLPVREYMHTSVANIMDNSQVSLEGIDYCKTGRLVQYARGGYVEPHNTGIFTARQPMDVLGGIDQHFNVRLYMASSASALVMDVDRNAGIAGDIRVEIHGMADGFEIADSVFTFSSNPIVRTDRITVGAQQCFASVHFPSRDVPPPSKVIIDIDDPSEGLASDEPIWQWHVYVPLEDGTVTESVLGVRTPLMAGQLKIVKAKILSNGSASVEDPTVGVSVTLDWHDAGQHEVEF